MGHLLSTAGGLCQKGHRTWGSALSFMECLWVFSRAGQMLGDISL